ncbi:hypothetical protein [Pedobacter sp. MR22-3]|uniref:hypothetical protein n=1 Tax=Pedobacter sp. MR22-3 TaxID=2994552 RepID=UPI002245E077|nr:hypothetical protein [Pedobacter sp. MR22-3]MCX2582746.1 hypothetical protein [Pedobacter sp. MR22-3]
MFEEYKSSLLDFYHVKRKSQRLTLNLDQPGREKLRKECVEVFLRKNTQKDKDLIRFIFDPRNQFDDQVRSIERFKLDKFRPLVSFMVEGRSTRDEGLVKLLAWLIDFPSYNEWRELSEEELKFIFEEAAKKPEEDANDVTIDEGELKNEEEAIQVEDSNDDQPKKEEFKKEGQSGGELENDRDGEESNPESEYVRLFSPRYITISCILLLFIGSTSFVAWETSPSSIRMPKADEGCMYWNEDHYEPVKCGTQMANATIIPLNLKKLQRQRKINLSDTLTSYSLGKVWYKGFVKNHEFFTDSGAYPLDTQRVLKPLSNTILTKYTSNYRYWNARLAWFLCAAFFISLCGFAVSKLEKEVITKDDSGAQDTQAVLPLAEEPIVEQTEGSLAM